MKYYQMYLEKYPNQNNKLPKFIHYAGHQETLGEFFEALDQHRPTRAPPASALFFEFLRD